MDFSIFLTAEAWISLIALIFLEIVLGVDNIVFISITSDRLPEEKQHLGRKLGLAGAMIMRILFLCFASYLVHIVKPLFTLNLGFYAHGISIRDLVMLCGGLYLLYKGWKEIRDMLQLKEQKASESEEGMKALHSLTLPKAIGTIMVMDIVFSIDSVITAVGMAEHLIIMILAVMIAVILMMVFIDPISNFINKHAEMKILALTFIFVIGILLVADGLDLHTGFYLLGMHAEKTMVYFAMIFAFVLELLQMKYNQRYEAWHDEQILKKRAAEEAEIVREIEAARELELEEQLDD